MPFLDWTNVQALQLSKAVVRPAVLFRMATAPVIRLWGPGVGDLAIGADLIEEQEGAVYRGVGELLSLPVVNQLINGLAERAQFSLSGTPVTGEVAAIASTEAADIRGAAVNLGFLVFDEAWQIASPTSWLWDGEADSLSVNRSASPSGAERTLTLSVGSLFTGRNRPSMTYFTDPDQRRRSADDRFCDRVKLYEQGTTKVWPI